MKHIRKKDIVVLPDGCFALTLDVYPNREGKMYEVKRMDNEEIHVLAP